MKNSKTIVSTAVASVLAWSALGVIDQASAGPVAPKKGAEKCYGVVKAEKNDCKTMSSACAGHSTEDNQADAWIYLPKGTCERIVGGTLEPKA